MKSDRPYLEHIRDAIALIRNFVGDSAEHVLVLEPNELVRSGVVRQLEIIGEAVKHLGGTTTNKEPQIPWTDIAGTRDKLIHEYFGVDYEQVLAIITDDLDELDRAIGRLLKN